MRAAETLYVLALAREALGERTAGHAVAELERDPELTALRADPAYHRMMLKRAGGR